MTGQSFTLQTHAAGNRATARRVRATRPVDDARGDDSYPAHWLPLSARRALAAGRPPRRPNPFGR